MYCVGRDGRLLLLGTSKALNCPLEGIAHSLSGKDEAFLRDCYKPQTAAQFY